MTLLGIGEASDNDTFQITNWNRTYSKGCRFGIVCAPTGVWISGKPSLREYNRLARHPPSSFDKR
jgi:hypothetical protein